MTNTITSNSDKSSVKNKFAIGGILFSILYIFAELTFNLGLVDFLNSKNTDMDTFKNLETFGRILSSVGIGLLAYKLMQYILTSKNKSRKGSFFASSIAFFSTAIMVYAGQTIIFNKILDEMSDEQNLSAYAFGVYRNLNLNNQVTLNIFKDEDKQYDQVINSMLGVLTTNPTIDKEIESSVKKFFHAENNLDQKLLGSIYDEMQFSVPNVDKYWGIYAIESRRYENYTGFGKKQYLQKFQEQIGLPPSLSKAQFEARLKSKMSPDKSVLNAIVIVPAHDSLNMKRLTIGDIPDGLSKQKWVAYVNNHVNSALEKGKFKKENVKTLPHSREIISSVVITPFAIIFSMIALFLNVCTLVIALFVFLGKFAFLPGIATAGLFVFFINNWTYNPYGLNTNLNKLIGSETKMTQMFSGYTKIIHGFAIDDKNPNTYKIIRLEKPKMPDMSKIKNDLDQQFKNLKNTGDMEESQGMKNLSRSADEVKVDLKELEENKHYYGELNKKNPYAK